MCVTRRSYLLAQYYQGQHRVGLSANSQPNLPPRAKLCVSVQSWWTKQRPKENVPSKTCAIVHSTHSTEPVLYPLFADCSNSESVPNRNEVAGTMAHRFPGRTTSTVEEFLLGIAPNTGETHALEMDIVEEAPYEEVSA